MCSIHRQTYQTYCARTHHTLAYLWRGDRVMKPIRIWGWLGGHHDGQRPMGKFGQDAGVTPLLFFEGHPGIFNDHRESGPRFNISSERRCFFFSIVSPSLYWGARTHTDQRVTPSAGLPSTSSSSTWFSSEVSHPGINQAQPCLASVGDQSWATGWYGCWLRLFQYFGALSFSSTLTSPSVPAAEKQPHSMRLLPAHFTFGMVLCRWRAELLF